MNKEKRSTCGLILITVWSAVQYIFLQNVPDSVSAFAFLCITNVLGLIILAVTQLAHLKKLKKRTWWKGAFLAMELVGFNFFLLIGSRNMDSVSISSIVSMYFVFITPILLLLRKRVNFQSTVATILAIIALLLMFEADMAELFTSRNVGYLILADLFFAAYVVTISVLGEKEDPALLAISQLSFAGMFSFAGWILEAMSGHGNLSLPSEPSFWVSAVFIGVFIRALYSLIQIACQKNVPPLNTSLIFSSEIIMTLILNPLLCRLFQQEYVPPTLYQIVGCVFFVIAVLIADETFMSRFGYRNTGNQMIVNEKGETVRQSSVSRKIINMTLLIGMSTLLISTMICLTAIQSIRNKTVTDSTSLGQRAAFISEQALMEELEQEMTQMTQNRAKLAEEKLSLYAKLIQYVASYAGTLYTDPQDYAPKEVWYPMEENGGVWTMQRSLASREIAYQDVRKENLLLGNLEAVFEPVVKNQSYISTIYYGTQDGLLISYDVNSDYADTPGEENYYEYRNMNWYQLGEQAEKAVFTDTYQDGYGRGLTITCVAPVYDKSGIFYGCVAMDILVEDMNHSMVNDGIEEPDQAVLIDDQENIIASNDIDLKSKEQWNIQNQSIHSPLKMAAKEIQGNREGITSVGSGEEQIYLAYATIPLTGWKLCLISPVSKIIAPAVTIRDSIDENTSRVAESVIYGIRVVIENCLVMFGLILLVITYFAGRFAKRITDPLNRLEVDVKEISQGNFDRRTQVDTNDEIGNLARSFNQMSESLQNYMEDLKIVTAKEERIASELSVATKIQANMLPNVFPEFPDHKELDLFAMMRPAKEVGGDFYDYFLIDDTHLGLVVADVSGKGVPAALFMVISKTLIKNRALMGGSPAEILGFVNNQLCENNELQMFVTAWLGIVDLATGLLTAANAGHEYPAIKRAGKRFELLKDRHGFVLAGMEGISYQDYTILLAPGDMLYLYTDGVTEAINAEEELYGTGRMLDALNLKPEIGCEQVLTQVEIGIDRFVKDAPQFDDITMLCFQFQKLTDKYKGE